MDVYCKRCGEPWDNDEFHEVAKEYNTTYDKVTAAFRIYGCVAFEYAPETVKKLPPGDLCKRDESIVTLAAEAAYELCGNDMDGAASLVDDTLYMLRR